MSPAARFKVSAWWQSLGAVDEPSCVLVIEGTPRWRLRMDRTAEVAWARIRCAETATRQAHAAATRSCHNAPQQATGEGRPPSAGLLLLSTLAPLPSMLLVAEGVHALLAGAWMAIALGP